MKRAIFSTAIFFIICFLFQGMALATGGSWGHSHSNTPRVHNLADILKSGEIVGEVNFCGAQGTNGAHVDLVGESFTAVLGASGDFKLRYVPRGAYTLRVSIPGQPEHTQPVTVKRRQVTDIGGISLCPDNDGDGFTLAEDCNDNNASINPDAEELCDGVDNDCDGAVDGPGCECTDADNDGFFAQEGCGTAVDCNDDNDTINPSATEICDGVDNNCDGTDDEGFDLNTDLNNCGVCTSVCSGSCQGGVCFAICGNNVVEEGEECDDGNTEFGDECNGDCTLPAACNDGTPSGESRPCDGPDSDQCVNGLQTCENGVFSACEETITDIVEICNGIDDDCDGQTDEDFPDVGQACSVGVGECFRTGVTVCSSSGTTTQCSAIPGAPSAEACNGIDDNCDGQIDEGNVCAAACGNGVVDFGEQCDDGNNIDGDGCQANCTIPECSTTTQCSSPPNSSGVCENDGTCGFTCSNGFADCDGNPQNGCELLLNTDPSCSSFLSLGSVKGDMSSANLTTQNRGEANFRVRVDEADVSPTSVHDLGVRINLTVPQGTDYDLEATCDNCGGSAARVSTNSGSTDEQLFLRWDEGEICTFGVCVPSGTDSSRYIYIRVIYKSASVCDNWILSVSGNIFSGANTCPEK